ncbi:hypothetical protein JTF06_01760 [Desemzia sp. RIT804]|uniref:CAP-associated domain-containing protein n=1 Tax=Desemzia sp. RIT 804 TaxID=2810209 RepID=UPI00194F0716|nr:CAP-associated domain-containing protein [Desemzia sp. RIT 804]MBM6613616.1 hypothetical protein [Desemzia sp. RIT 804]
MKTVRKTLLLFVVFLLGSYLFPLIFHFDQTESIVVPEESSSENPEITSMLETADLEQSFVSSAGFSNYVGMAVDDFMVDYGDPSEIKFITDDSEIWIYGSESVDYLQLMVTNYVVSEILVLGSSIEIPPFEMGMERADMYQVASFDPTFEVHYENQLVQINLNENELNNQPLVAFDNQTYAVLTMDKQTNTIIGIHYMSNESLIHSGMYEVSSFSSLTEEPVVQMNQAIQEKVKSEQILQYINIMRRKMGLEALEYSLVLSAVGNELYKFHETTQEEESSLEPASQQESNNDALVINDDASIEIIEEGKEAADSATESESEPLIEENTLDQETIQAYLNEESIQLDNVRLLYQPVLTKPSVYVLQWFTLVEYREILMDKSMKRIGISFRGDELLLILDNGFEIGL